MTDLLQSRSLDKDIPKSTCIGKVYRANVSHCQTKTGVLFAVRLQEMKRLSCPGCEYCSWLDECLGEISLDWGITNIVEVEDGKLYTITVCNVQRDWESGMVDDWDLKLVEYKEEIRDD